MEGSETGRYTRAPLPRCELCGELIGVYEPFVVEDPDGWRTTSLAAEPELVAARVSLRHPACATDEIPG